MGQFLLTKFKVKSSAGNRFAGRSALLLIVTLFVLLGLLYDFYVPFFEKPDELKHFAVMQYIHNQGALPVVRAGEYKPWDQEGTQPPLYHLIAAAVTTGLDLSHFTEPPRNPHYADERSFIWRERGNNNLYLHTPNEAWSNDPVFLAARLARWVSLLAGVGTVCLTYFLAGLVFANERISASANQPIEGVAALSPLPRSPAPLLSLLSAALVAFVPQFLHTSTAISNDGLSATLAAAGLYILALIIKNGSSRRYGLALGLVLGLGAITKLSLLYLLPLTGLVWLGNLYRQRSWQRFWIDGVIVTGLIGLLAGWWFWRNWHIYGDVTGLNAHLLYRGGPLNPTPSLSQIWQTELTGLELSFWAAFGAGQILLEPWLYEGLRWLKYVILIGGMVGVWRKIRGQWPVVRGPWSKGERRTADGGRSRYHQEYQAQAIILALLALWALVVFIALLRWMQITPASWGRLLYPALPALSILSVWSLAQFRFQILDFRFQISHFTIHTSPFTIHNSLLPTLVALLLFALALLSPFYYLQPAYAKTTLINPADLPASGWERLDVTYEGGLRLLGYSLEKSAVQPGDWLPVTLYWQATQPISKNYSVFGHGLGKENKVVGQVNTYPQGGNWPTSMLPPGQVLMDHYHLLISPEAEAPALIRLAVGIFEFEDPAKTAKAAVNAAGQTVTPIVGATPLLPRVWPELQPDQRLIANFGGQIRLIGYDWLDRPAKAGEQIPITFYWETLAAPGQNLTLFIHLVDATNRQVAGFDAPPAFPTAYWQPGYRLADPRLLSLPKDLPPGEYRVQLGWYNPETGVRLPLADGGGDALPALTISVGASQILGKDRP